MKMKRILSTLALTVVLGVVLTSCATAGTATTTTAAPAATTTKTAAATTTAAPTTAASEKPFVIGLSTCDGGNVVQSAMVAASKAEIEKLGGKCIIADAVLDQAKQMSDVEDLIQKGVDAMIIEAVDSTAFSPALIKCQEAGIPVITQNAQAPAEFKKYVTGAVFTDNVQAGHDLGQAYFSDVKEGKIILYTYNVVDECRVEADTFKAAQVEFAPNVQIVLATDAGNSTEVATKTMESWMQAYPDLVGIYCFNPNVATGCIAAVKSAGKSDQIKICWNGLADKASLDVIKDGPGECLAVFPALKMGETCGDLAVKAAKGETVPIDTKIPFEIVTKSTLDEWYAKLG